MLLSLWLWRRFSFQRGLQALSLTLFIALLWLAGFEGRPGWPVDFFLFSDPLVAVVHTVAGRVWVGLFGVSLAFVLLAALMGRVFCSHVCPLGTLFDLGDRFLARRPEPATENRERYRRARRAKFVFLLVILGAAFGGLNLLGFGDPIAIATRFAATVFYPAVMALVGLSVAGIHLLGDWSGSPGLAYLEAPVLPSFEGALALTGLLVLLLLLGRLQARFWCRHLCPLGALLAWVGRWAPYRRRVDGGCTHCDRCVRECPTGAIHGSGLGTDHAECIACQNCVRVCPGHAVRFGFTGGSGAKDATGADLGRRAFAGAAASGLAMGLVFRADMLHPSGFGHPELIRPPGAIVEPEFLSRCMSCGECLRACPTNTLQPDWFRAGLEGLWAPRMDLRHAACDQACNVCGLVCPTGSIRPLSLEERRYARVGTAVLLRDRCLPWARDEKCLVCSEQCPYGAVDLEQDEHHGVELPVVRPEKCNGCGRCEELCPVLGDAAIVVTPHEELRLAEGSYLEACRAAGVTIEPKRPPDELFRVDDSRLPGQPPDFPAPHPDDP
ncbi:MAG: 4Fe-4S dicluster domain-containing protein [Deltaproteobacteria bacterium]|nr:4Fe-4S dicluster domain-containing protein [Deltaproteobacteria bacterium]